MKSLSVLAPRLRAVFISDVHLGSANCHAQELAEFLESLNAEKLYLVGDIIDFWWMAQRRASWGAPQVRVVEALHRLAQSGVEIIYVPGNHDRCVRQLCGLVLPQMQIRRRAIHTTITGRRLLVTHGDDYDNQTQFGGFQEKLGDWLYEQILAGNRLTNQLGRKIGFRYWSLAEFLKRQSGAALRYIERFVAAGLDDAKCRGLDGIVCGHIHRAALIERDGLVYANDGDWVESLTSVLEDQHGRLQLWGHGRGILASIGHADDELVEISLDHAA